MNPSMMVPLKVESVSYRHVGSRLFITPELKAALTMRKRRDGSSGYASLTRRGFQGGKHLIEVIHQELGNDVDIVLTHEQSTADTSCVAINFEAFRSAGNAKFFEVYRTTGLQNAVSFLSSNFPAQFGNFKPPTTLVRKAVSQVFGDLPEAAKLATKKDLAGLPDQLANLVEHQGTGFVIEVLTALDGAIPKGQDRVKIAFSDVIKKVASEPAEAMQQLTDLMSQWNLMQLTSLLNVVKTRLATIDSFEDLIENDSTYEIRTDNSIHRILERSMWLLDDSYWIAQSNKSLRTLIGNELAKEDKQYKDNRPDFACVDASSGRVLVEIKRPSLELKKKEVDQAELYLRIVKKHQGSITKKPKIFLVGRTVSNEARELAEMRGYPVLLTYSDMISGCRQRYQEYLKIVQAEGRG